MGPAELQEFCVNCPASVEQLHIANLISNKSGVDRLKHPAETDVADGRMDIE
jgi:hypothetical protein